MKKSVLNALGILAENGVSLNPNKKEKREKAHQLLIEGYQNYKKGYSKVAIELFSVAATTSCDYWLPYAASAEVYAEMRDFDNSGRFARVAKQMAGYKTIDNLNNLIVCMGLENYSFVNDALNALDELDALATDTKDEIHEIARLKMEFRSWDKYSLKKTKKNLKAILQRSTDSLVLECVSHLLAAIETALENGDLFFDKNLEKTESILLSIFKSRIQDGFAKYLSSVKEEN